MAVELDGSMRMRGETGPGVGVRVLAENRRLRLVSGNELVGDWQVGEIGISALQDGFSIKAEGEEFLLRTEDDVALADEIGLSAASPRLARLLAARHNPEEPPQVEEEDYPVSSNLAAIGFALAGAMIVLGAVILDQTASSAPRALSGDASGTSFDFWIAFVVGGILMIGTAYVMSIGTRFARIVALVVLLCMLVVFGFAVAETNADTSQLAAYGFLAGGLVVGVAVLVSGSLREP